MRWEEYSDWPTSTLLSVDLENLTDTPPQLCTVQSLIQVPERTE